MKIARKIAMAVLVLLVLGGTFGGEYLLAQSVQGEAVKSSSLSFIASDAVQVQRNGVLQSLIPDTMFQIAAGDRITILPGNTLTMHLADKAFLRLDGATSMLVLSTPAPTSESTEKLVFRLEQGKVWSDTSFTLLPVEFRVGRLALAPAQAQLDLDFFEDKLTVRSFRHHAEVSLFNASEEVVNSFLLAPGNQFTAYMDKIENSFDTLSKLLYTKLIKEFQYGRFGSDVVSQDAWIRQSRSESDRFQQDFSNAAQLLMRKRGLTVQNLYTPGFYFQKSLERIRNAATFDVRSRIEIFLSTIFQNLHDAEYLSIVGRAQEAIQRFQYLDVLLQENPFQNDPSFAALWKTGLEKEYESLLFVTPSNPLYAVQEKVFDLLLNEQGSEGFARKFLLLRHYLDGAHASVEQDAQVARNLLEKYYEHIVKVLAASKSQLSKLQPYLAEDNQLMDNLLRQYAPFYRDHIFAMKHNLEQQWLASVQRESEKNEIKQTIVSTKIDFLKQLQNFFLEDKIAVQDARQIVFRLFREAEELQLPASAQVAVAELFAKRLEDFGVFFRFLNASEFVNTTLYGTTHREQFAQFLRLQQSAQEVGLEEVRKEILGEEKAGTPVKVPVKRSK